MARAAGPHILSLWGLPLFAIRGPDPLYISRQGYTVGEGRQAPSQHPDLRPQARLCCAPNTSTAITCVTHGDAPLDSPRGPTCPFVGGPRQVRVAHCHGPPSCQALRTYFLYSIVYHPEVNPKPRCLSCPCATQGEHSDPWYNRMPTIKLRTQFFGACSLQLCTRVV